MIGRRRDQELAVPLAGNHHDAYFVVPAQLVEHFAKHIVNIAGAIGLNDLFHRREQDSGHLAFTYYFQNIVAFHVVNP